MALPLTTAQHKFQRRTEVGGDVAAAATAAGEGKIPTETALYRCMDKRHMRHQQQLPWLHGQQQTTIVLTCLCSYVPNSEQFSEQWPAMGPRVQLLRPTVYLDIKPPRHV
jgi:hypothetical protein